MAEVINRAALALKRGVAHTPLYPVTKRFLWSLKQLEWRLAGRAAPPSPVVKQRVVRQHGLDFGLRVLVETGTYMGEMVDAMRDDFDWIYSVELDLNLFERARLKFAKFPHIQIMQGDSAEVLREILKQLDQPALFWLDAHYSGGITAIGSKITPVSEELGQILAHHVQGHVVLIDDARDFSGSNDYPTIRELQGFVKETRSDWTLEVKDDIIRTHGPCHEHDSQDRR